jgi:predicted enzyme related to lactoylglutathione lyase/mannose-6-phosphate isomerase-like protein (cupin superfamily)
MAEAFDLESEYVILDRESGARTAAGGAAFWEALMGGRLPEVERGRLVTIGESTESWTNWEMHPQGEEVIVLLEGRVEFVLEVDGSERVVALDRPGRCLVIPRGTWHTARLCAPARMLFVTAGAGTQHRVAEPSTVAAKPMPQFGHARAGAPAFVEIGVPAGGEAARFYAALFGWSIHEMGNDNFWAQTPSVTVGIHPGDEDRNMVPYFEVDDLAVAVARVRELGGTAPGPSDETPGFGTFVECRDPQGVRFGLHHTQR